MDQNNNPATPAEPVQPNFEPAQPTPIPAQPTPDSAQPVAEPAQPTFESTPVAEPAQSTPAPTATPAGPAPQKKKKGISASLPIIIVVAGVLIAGAIVGYAILSTGN